MTLQETIASNIKEAMKGQDELQLGVLRMLASAIHNREIEKKGKGDTSPLSDDEVRDVVRKEVKKRKEAITLYEQGNRHDLAEKESKELKTLEVYLPPELSVEEIKTLVRPIVEQAKSKGVQEFGKVMGLVMAEVKGKADAQTVRSLVEEFLA